IRTIVVVTCLCRRERPLCKHRYPIYRWHTILRRIVIQIIRDILPAILAHLKLIYTHLDKLGIHSLYKTMRDVRRPYKTTDIDEQIIAKTCLYRTNYFTIFVNDILANVEPRSSAPCLLSRQQLLLW